MNKLVIPILVFLILNSHHLFGNERTDADSENLNGKVKAVQTVEYQTSRNIEFTDLFDERTDNVDFGDPHNVRTVRFNINGSYQEIVDEFPSLNNYNRVVWKYKSSGQKEQIEYYNKDDQLVGKVLFKNDRANRMTILVQDDRGNLIEEWTHFLNSEGDSIRIIGYKYSSNERIRTRNSYRYNRRGQLVTRRTKINGKTTFRENYKYNDAGILIWEKSFSEDGTREVYYESNGERLQEIETYVESSVLNTMRPTTKQIHMAITVHGSSTVRTAYLRDGSVDSISTSLADRDGSLFTTTIKDAHGEVTEIDTVHYTYDRFGNWILRRELHIYFERKVNRYSRADRLIEYYKSE